MFQTPDGYLHFRLQFTEPPLPLSSFTLCLCLNLMY
jgi:hypothetical protein